MHQPDPAVSGQITQILADLVSFDTTSCRSNAALAAHIIQIVQPFGADVRTVPAGPDGKVNLWITFGPQNLPGYVLSGHCDTVPVTEQAWSSNPFLLREADGKLFGRGTTDMKGFLAVCLAHAGLIARAPLKRPIHLAISCDEEVGCIGVRPLLTWLSGQATRPLGCFVGEPTGMDLVIGHKGKQTHRMTVQGTAGHSSLSPWHVNAVEWAARFIDRISTEAARLAAHGARDLAYDVPHTTLLATMVQGGTALNIVPARCVVDWECRTIWADEPLGIADEIAAAAVRELGGQMRGVQPTADLKPERGATYPGLNTPIGHPVVGLALRLLGCGATRKVAFGTEAGLFSAAGVPSVVVGPGSIAQAHTPDEFIETGQLAGCAAFVRALVGECTCPMV